MDVATVIELKKQHIELTLFGDETETFLEKPIPWLLISWFLCHQRPGLLSKIHVKFHVS